MLTIPPLEEKDYFYFRFKDDNTRIRRYGALVEIKEEEEAIPKLFRLKSKFDYHNKKHHEVIQTQAHLLNWCVYCEEQSPYILLYKKQGIWCREKLCESHAESRIIRL